MATDFENTDKITYASVIKIHARRKIAIQHL